MIAQVFHAKQRRLNGFPFLSMLSGDSPHSPNRVAPPRYRPRPLAFPLRPRKPSPLDAPPELFVRIIRRRGRAGSKIAGRWYNPSILSLTTDQVLRGAVHALGGFSISCFLPRALPLPSDPGVLPAAHPHYVLGCAFGGLIFGLLWNSNLTKRIKGVSAKVCAALYAVCLALFIVATPAALYFGNAHPQEFLQAWSQAYPQMVDRGAERGVPSSDRSDASADERDTDVLEESELEAGAEAEADPAATDLAAAQNTAADAIAALPDNLTCVTETEVVVDGETRAAAHVEVLRDGRDAVLYVETDGNEDDAMLTFFQGDKNMVFQGDQFVSKGKGGLPEDSTGSEQALTLVGLAGQAYVYDYEEGVTEYVLVAEGLANRVFRVAEELRLCRCLKETQEQPSGRMGACYAYCLEIEGGHGRPRHQRQRAVGEGGAFGGEPLPLALQSLEEHPVLALGRIVPRVALPARRFARVRAGSSRGARLTSS